MGLTAKNRQQKIKALTDEYIVIPAVAGIQLLFLVVAFAVAFDSVRPLKRCLAVAVLPRRNAHGCAFQF